MPAKIARKKSSEDKRKHPRFPVGITMDLHAKGQAVGKCRGTITDLSISGMTLKTNAELDEGSVLYLKINMPLEIRGEVRHIKAGSGAGLFRYGVKFHHIGAEGPKEARPEYFIAAKFQK